MGEGHLKCVQLCTVGEGVTPHIYVRIYTVSFHVFARILLKNYFTLLKKDVFVRKVYFSQTRLISVVMK